MRLFRIVNRETIILAKLQRMIGDGKNLNSQFYDLSSKISLHRSSKLKSNRFCSKSIYLQKLYEQIKDHRNSMLDKAISYLRVMMDYFMVFESLDYPRLLYTSRQIVNCKSILLSSIKASSQEQNTYTPLFNSKFPNFFKDPLNLYGHTEQTLSTSIGNNQQLQEFIQKMANNRMYIENSDDPEDNRNENNLFKESIKKVKFQ